VLKKAFRRGLVEFLAIIKVIFNIFHREFFWALIIVQGKVSQASEVIVQGALCLAIDGKALC